MSAEHYIKSLCPLCDGSIEFPTQAFGEMVNCPHCQNLIELGKPSEPPIKQPPLPKPPAEPYPFHWVWDRIRKPIPNWQIAAVICVLSFSGTGLFIYEDSQQRKAEALQRAQQVDQEAKRLNDVASQAMARQSAAAFLDAPAVRFTPPTPQSKLLTDADVGIEPQKNANGTPAGAWASTLVPVMTENNLFLDPATGKLYRVLSGKIFEETNPYAGMTPEQIDLLEINLLAHMRSDIANQGPPIAAYHPTPTPDYTSAFYQHQLQPQQISSPSFVTPSVVVSASSYDPNSLANPYGAGSPYKSDGLMNPYSRYGSPYSSQSWRNPYATDTPKLYDNQGNYRGKLSSNPYDLDSTANPYGRYGSRYSSESINNPYGAGNPYDTTPIHYDESLANWVGGPNRGYIATSWQEF